MQKSYSMGQCILNKNGSSLEGDGWFQGAMSLKAGEGKVGREGIENGRQRVCGRVW